MKLNPPDTAPKDALILGDVGHFEPLTPIIWNPSQGAWSAALMFADKQGNNQWDMYFENHTIEPDKLRGWLPLPKIDDEGNVA